MEERGNPAGLRQAPRDMRRKRGRAAPTGRGTRVYWAAQTSTIYRGKGGAAPPPRFPPLGAAASPRSHLGGRPMGGEGKLAPQARWGAPSPNPRRLGPLWGANQPIVGWCAPLGPPHAPRVGNPRVGGRPTWFGGTPPLGRPPLLEIPSPRAGAPPWGAYIKGGGRGSRTLDSWRLPLPCYTSPSRRSLAKPYRVHSCIHHHVVVLLYLHQPLLPPCWIKKEETSSQPYVC